MKFTTGQKEKLAALTPFQRAVLLECARIPKGKTRTYAQIARAIGKPKAARAVGNALAINPLAPVIPCHRVVRSDGGVGGYSARGGAKRKTQLLLNEFDRRLPRPKGDCCGNRSLRRRGVSPFGRNIANCAPLQAAEYRPVGNEL